MSLEAVPGSAALGPAWLFCPGVRPSRFSKALASSDVVILDLEDAVASDQKAAARSNVVAALMGGDVPPDRAVVRVNGARTPWFNHDIAALRQTPLRMVMLPKADSPLPGRELEGYGIVALCETAAGLMDARRIGNSEGCIALALGGQDLAADLGASTLNERGVLHATLLHARMLLRFAAAASGALALDTVRVAFGDDEGLAREASAAASAGFDGKLIVHPRQANVVRAAFRPSDDDLIWARGVVEAASHGGGATVYDGEMVDAAVLLHARRLLHWATYE